MLVKVVRRIKEASEREKCIESLEYIATEKLGYTKVSKTFHSPMLRDWDAIDHRRFQLIQRGEFDSCQDTLNLWPRYHIKTWLQRARTMRYLLKFPWATGVWWHDVEEMAQESVSAIGETLQKNLALRKVFKAGTLPPMYGKFVGAKGFKLPANRVGDAITMRAYGAGSEVTGGHALFGVLDDVIGFKTLVQALMATRRLWYKATVLNVVKEGWLDAIGTRWDPDDVYNDWIESPYWEVVVRAALETDGKPDYKGKPVFLSLQRLLKEMHEMGDVMFAFQMMNDATGKKLRSWDQHRCEHRVPYGEHVPTIFFVLNDPAPRAIGSGDLRQFKKRGDATHDYWAIAVVGVRAQGNRVEKILVDGKASPDWDEDEGMLQAARLAKKWGATPFVGFEELSQRQGHYADVYKTVARKLMLPYIPIEFKETGAGKGQRIGSLTGVAKQDEFLISQDTCDQEFLEMFLSQIRSWPQTRYDDCADAVSYIQDSGLTEWMPVAGADLVMPVENKIVDPLRAIFHLDPEEEYSYRTRGMGM